MNASHVVSRLCIPAIVMVALLGPGFRAFAATEQGEAGPTGGDSRCSNHTLKGLYAFHIEGVFVDSPVPLPLSGVAMTRFDGRGKLRQVDHVVFNGMTPPVDWTPATGTYRVNPDCTGEAEIIIPGSPFSPVTLRLVVGDAGHRIETVVSKPGYVVTSSATKVDSSD